MTTTTHKLPPLPGSDYTAWLKNGERCNAFPWSAESPLASDGDGYWAAKGFAAAPLFTAEQMHAYARAALPQDQAEAKPAEPSNPVTVYTNRGAAPAAPAPVPLTDEQIEEGRETN